METILQLLTGVSSAHTILVIALVIALGLALGSIRIFGVNLGVAGVLFAGIAFGHFKIHIQPEILEFTREFGLILFVYTIGMQVGPGFFSSFKRDGIRMNVLAAMIVLVGAVITVALSKTLSIPFPVAVGMFSGATTNTPSLAAAQQALQEVASLGADALRMPGLGYAVCYPFGIVGIILSMIAIRIFFKIDPKEEGEHYSEVHAKHRRALEVMDFKVENPNLNGCALDAIPLPAGGGLVISRVLHQGETQIAMPDTLIFPGDILRAVGPRERLEDLKLIIGQPVTPQWGVLKESIITKRVVVTRRDVAGKSIGDLDPFLYGVTVTRISRAEVEFAATPDVEINFADTLLVVGEEEGIRKFALIVGNSVKALDHPELIPVFIGIALGVILGSLPFHFPGMPAPLKLGLAGGPLLVAMLLSRIGRFGKLIWYMPISANFMLREIGISLFLACVGLKSGDQFLATLTQGQGMVWLAGGALITVVPLLLAGVWARFYYKMNYLSVCGLLAGSMTDPPALAFANQITASNAQVISYAAVYPLVMIMRVVVAQILVLLFAHG